MGFHDEIILFIKQQVFLSRCMMSRREWSRFRIFSTFMSLLYKVLAMILCSSLDAWIDNDFFCENVLQYAGCITPSDLVRHFLERPYSVSYYFLQLKMYTYPLRSHLAKISRVYPTAEFEISQRIAHTLSAKNS